MNNIEYGVTPQGFRAKRLIDIKNELEDLFIGEFGDINLDAQSVTGQLIGVYSKVLADIWENMEMVYFSQYPNSAFGISLDNVVQLNGLTRLQAEATRVIGVVTGSQGTLIPSGALVRVAQTGELFYSKQSVVISAGNSIQNIVRVNALAAQEYTVLISNIRYIYSLPIINFSAPLVSGNSVAVRINGVNIPSVSYAGSSPATLDNLKNTIIANSNGAVSATSSVQGNTIELVPNLGKQITVNSVNVNGVGAPTYSLIFKVPATLDDIAENLAANINNSSNVSGVYPASTGTDSFLLTARDDDLPYSLAVGTNLQITRTSTPVEFFAQTLGPIAVPVGTLTEIVTPVAGWQSVNNFEAGITGRNAETDVELRLRRLNSLRALGYATVEAIISRVSQEVPGVTSVLVFENITITQQPILVTFDADFESGDAVGVNLDGNNIGTINYVSSNLQVVTDVASLLASQPEIKSALVQGVGDHSILITMNETETIELLFNITGTTVPNYVVSGGRPPKSFETVVEGGTDAAVALKIWQVKPAGIQTFGNIAQPILDSQGNTQIINFSRATPIYIWVTVALTLNPQENFPSNGQELVSEAILAYGNSLGIGVDVFIQRVQAAVFSIPGIASATVLLAKTLNATDTPTYSNANIVIQETEVSVWDLSRITVSI